ncbi:MAG: CoA transferase [Deltaproteobacteria bacterium]|nr:CoA transferase [Deltaproteobacteria bacterium]
MKQALSGVRVLDLTQVMAGPFCAMLLGDQGADVIKIEPPEGDATRRMGKSFGKESVCFWAMNRNKRAMTLNLKDPRAQEIVRTLAARTDILVENYRPGVMKAFGLGYDQLHAINPRLIYASISGFGATGPYAQRGGFDLVAQGMSGIMSITGEVDRPPVKCGIPVTDLGAGLLALQAILAAYIHRLQTGEGQFIDTSLFEAGVALSIWESTQYFSTGEIPEPVGSAHRMSAPYQAIRCADGYITLGAANQRTWERFAHTVGLSELIDRPEYKENSSRVQHRHQLARDIEVVTITQPRAHWLALLEEAGVPCGPIYNYAEVFADPHVQARELAQEMDHPVGGRIKVLGPAVKLSETPAQLARRSPLYGEHTAEILREIGYTESHIQELASTGAIILGE